MEAGGFADGAVEVGEGGEGLKRMRASQGVGVKRPRSVMPSRIRVAFPRREHVERTCRRRVGP